MVVNILCLGAVGIGSIILRVADHQKMFRKHDVDVHLVPVTGTQIPDLTITNPMGHIGAPAALLRAAGGTDLRVLACFDNAMLSSCLTVRSEFSKPEQLKRKRLGARVTGAAMWLHTVLALETMGLDFVRDDIEIAEIGDPAAVIAALESGQIDGAVLSRAQCEQLVPKGFKILLDMAPLQIYGAPDALVVSNDFLRLSPEEPKRILAAMIEAVACVMSQHRQSDVSDAIRSTLALHDDLAVEKAILEFCKSISLKPYPSIQRLSEMQRMMAAPRPAVTSVSIQGLVDQRLVQELDATGFIARTFSAYGIVM